jgi:iron-sulfur cluster repair protein YtfE (RIC family)
MNEHRGTAAYERLVQVHKMYRRQLAVLRRAVGEWVHNGGTTAVVTVATRHLAQELSGRDLRIHCLEFCQALTMHHSFEDTEIFPALRRVGPNAGSVVNRLVAEHEKISGLLAQLVAVADQMTEDRRSAPAVVAGLARLADELEAHLDHEEESLRPLFNEVRT